MDPRTCLDGYGKSRPPPGLDPRNVQPIASRDVFHYFPKSFQINAGTLPSGATTPLFNVVTNLLIDDVHSLYAVLCELGGGYRGSVFARNTFPTNTTEFARQSVWFGPHRANTDNGTSSVVMDPALYLYFSGNSG